MADDSTDERKPRRRRISGSVAVAVVLAAVVAAWIVSGIVAPGETTKVQETVETETPMPQVRVRASEAQPRTRDLRVTGRTDAIEDAALRAETAGRVEALHAAKGDTLKKGDVILELAMNDRTARLDRAEQRVAFAEADYEAARKLSKKQFQSEINVAEARATLAEAKAALAEIRLEIANTRIKAPIPGFLDELPVSIGDYVTIGEEVASMVDLDPIRVVAHLSEREVGLVKQGQKASARLPDGRTIEGEVRFVSRRGDEQSRTFRVDAWFGNPENAVPDGLTAELILPAESSQAHLVTPALLTLDEKGVLGVKVVDDEGYVQFREVRILDDTPEGMWIAGLPDRATLITVGQEFVTVGQKVDAVPEESLADRGRDGRS